jgi:preprotein translocase subunit YajC
MDKTTVSLENINKKVNSLIILVITFITMFFVIYMQQLKIQKNALEIEKNILKAQENTIEIENNIWKAITVNYQK